MSVVKTIQTKIFGAGSRTMNVLERQDQLRLQVYQQYYAFYAGKQWQHDREDDEELLTVNLCQAFVDKHAIFLAGKGWYLTDDNGPESKENIAFLINAWKRSDQDILCFANAHCGSLLGDAYLFFNEDENTGQVVAENIAAAYVTPRFHPIDKDLITHARIEFPVYFDNGDSQIVTYMCDSQSTAKYIDGQLVNVVYHLLGEVPLIHIINFPFPTQDFGRSDLYPLLDLQRQFNATLTDMNDIIAYHASPTTIFIGTKLNQLERGANKMIGGLPTNAKVQNLEMKNDLTSISNHLKEIKKLMHQLGNAPDIAFGNASDLKFSNSSGLALQLLYQPIIDVLTVKHKFYGAAYEKGCRIFLKWGIRKMEILGPVGNKAKEEFYRTKVNFRDPLPRDEVALLLEVKGKLEDGLMSVKDAHRALGDSDIDEKIREVQEDIKQGINHAYLAKHPPVVEQPGTGEPKSGSVTKSNQPAKKAK